MIGTTKSLFFDFSRSVIPQKVLDDFTINIQPKIIDYLKDMFNAGLVNKSENRKALHFATRTLLNDTDCIEIQRDNDLMFSEVEHLHELLLTKRKYIKTVINVGIGGSHLGPELLYRAFSARHSPLIEAKFISNIDPLSFQRATKDLDPKETLIIFSSKTFTTMETLSNLKLLSGWFKEYNLDLFEHSYVVTANPMEAKSVGFRESHILKFNDAIGGRFSVSSPIGFVLALAFGSQIFKQFLQGCAEIDQVIMHSTEDANMFFRHVAEIFLNRTFLGSNAMAVLPYSDGLDRFPSYLQQLFMESLGKSADRDGRSVGDAGLIIFGEVGTGAQHSFMQLLHQGSLFVPAEFLIIKPDRNESFYEQKRTLAINAIAQASALNQGRLIGEFVPTDANSKSKICPGGRPSTIVVLDDLSPRTLGNLIAWYEHIVVALGAAWGINPFDQWGVELGKKIAATLDQENEKFSDKNLHELIAHLEI